jgi:adenosylcobinamide-GDP ribazoletransferase
MADPRVGAFGAVALIVVLFARTTTLAVVPAKPLVIMGLWCGSRTLMAIVARALPYARGSGGLATSFGGEIRRHGGLPAWAAVAAYGMGGAVLFAVLGAGSRGLVVVLVEVLMMGVVVVLAHRRIGGYTGDVLGAGGVLAETAGLLALVAR